MTGHWLSYVADNLESLAAGQSAESSALIALFELVCEYESGGLTQYLINSSGDHIEGVRSAFSISGNEDGLTWLSNVERAYGGAIPSRRSARIKRISGLDGYKQGIDPFEAEDHEFLLLLPSLESIAENLLAAIRRR